MATYLELLGASKDDALNQKMRFAVVMAAELIRTESGATNNHANRLLWAKQVYLNPEHVANQMIMAVLAQNASSPLAAILAASDATIQTAVNAAIDVLA